MWRQRRKGKIKKAHKFSIQLKRRERKKNNQRNQMTHTPNTQNSRNRQNEAFCACRYLWYIIWVCTRRASERARALTFIFASSTCNCIFAHCIAVIMAMVYFLVHVFRRMCTRALCSRSRSRQTLNLRYNIVWYSVHTLAPVCGKSFTLFLTHIWLGAPVISVRCACALWLGNEKSWICTQNQAERAKERDRDGGKERSSSKECEINNVECKIILLQFNAFLMCWLLFRFVIVIVYFISGFSFSHSATFFYFTLFSILLIAALNHFN